jgi:hypothetical protein
MPIALWPQLQKGRVEERRSKRLAGRPAVLFHRGSKLGLPPRPACGLAVQTHVRTRDDEDERYGIVVL